MDFKQEMLAYEAEQQFLKPLRSGQYHKDFYCSLGRQTAKRFAARYVRRGGLFQAYYLESTVLSYKAN